MKRPRPERWSTLDLVEAFQLGHAVATLHDLNVLTSLQRPATAEAVAQTSGLDPKLVRGALEFVAARTNLVRRRGATFRATRDYSKQSRFLLDLYAGAYGKSATRLPAVMRTPSVARGTVDRIRHARAFRDAGDVPLPGLSALIQQLQFNHVLDVGSGSGALLVDLATRDPAFVGWGLELNPAMCKSARARIRSARLDKRVKVLQGDCRRLDAVLPSEVRARVQSVTACQTANELFGSGTAELVGWLRGLRQVLPGRPLLLADYYGRLGSRTRPAQRETLLHDYVQLISGQGIPPARMSEWRAIYADAGCRLAHVIEDTQTTRFIHIVVLTS